MSRFFLAALLILSAAGVRAQNFQMRIGGGVATHYNNATPIGFNYYFRLSAGHYIVASAGPYVAYGLGGKQTTRGDVGQIGSRKLYYDTQTFKEHGTHRFDGGLTIGLGYQLPSHLTLGIETDLGLTKFNATGDRNVTALVTLTYQF